jgi:DNA-binding transcriptional ArsR family regulator
MVARLTESDATVGQLAASYDVSLQAVSKHLKVLEDAGLVTRSRQAVTMIEPGDVLEVVTLVGGGGAAGTA